MAAKWPGHCAIPAARSHGIAGHHGHIELSGDEANYNDTVLKRRMVRLFSFLLLGALVNVAVAWGCALARGQDYRNWGYSLWTISGTNGHELNIRAGFPIR